MKGNGSVNWSLTELPSSSRGRENSGYVNYPGTPEDSMDYLQPSMEMRQSGCCDNGACNGSFEDKKVELRKKGSKCDSGK